MLFWTKAISILAINVVARVGSDKIENITKIKNLKPWMPLKF